MVVVVVVVVRGGGGGGRIVSSSQFATNVPNCTVCNRLIVHFLPRHTCPSLRPRITSGETRNEFLLGVIVWACSTFVDTLQVWWKSHSTDPLASRV